MVFSISGFICIYVCICFLNHLKVANNMTFYPKQVSLYLLKQGWHLRGNNNPIMPSHVDSIFTCTPCVPRPTFIAPAPPIQESFKCSHSEFGCVSVNFLHSFFIQKLFFFLMYDVTSEGNFKLYDKNVLQNNRPVFPVMGWTISYIQRGTNSSGTKP